MKRPLFLLTIPGLREADLVHMPATIDAISNSQANAQTAKLQHSFPAVTWPSQATLLTGQQPTSHGVIANGFFWREKNEVEMWTAWNEVIERPQLWDTLKSRHPELKTAAWFPMLSKGCGADYVCMPAPIHQPDGSEEMWCYTKPQTFYGELLEQFDHFPLHHFWGPLANIQSSRWIANSMAAAAKKYKPDFSYVYLPHLDYQAQKYGPDSIEAIESVKELDQLVSSFIRQVEGDSGYETAVDWLLVSEYVIQEVNHVVYPNRILRKNELLHVEVRDGLEYLDFQSPAWALVDHQFSHVFLNDPSESMVQRIAELFLKTDGISDVLFGDARGNLAHGRSGEIILVSEPNSWQAYYWWEDDQLAPSFAHNVDIHQKPGYDPVELLMNMKTRRVPLDASLIRGSHGVPCDGGIAVASPSIALPSQLKDQNVHDLVLDHFSKQ